MLSGPQKIWTPHRLEKPLVPAGNSTPIIGFPSHYNRWPVPKVDVYDRSVVIWCWQLSPNTYMFQVPQKAMEYARYAKWSTMRVLSCDWLQHKRMNERHRLPFRHSCNTQRDGSSVSEQDVHMSHCVTTLRHFRTQILHVNVLRYGLSYRGGLSGFWWTRSTY